MRHAPLYLYSQVRHIAELVGVVGRGEHRLGEVFAHLILINIKGGDEVDIANVVTAQVNVHYPRHELVFFSFLVEVDPLDKRAGAVSHADDGNIDFGHCFSTP